ncbi:unnamed protein product [Durusdinium trenchii]|uniref:EF-hand domain-containing protein n=1 Tax=Durusdinium trenchii TaxID=1381693 RepID=A0ABP0J6M3_9DINO
MYSSGYPGSSPRPQAVSGGSSPAASPLACASLSSSLTSQAQLPRPMAVPMAHSMLPAGHAASMPAATQAYWSPGERRVTVVSQQPVLRRSLGSSGAVASLAQPSSSATAPSTPDVEKELARRLDLCQEELARERSRSEELAAALHEARLKAEDGEVQTLRQQLQSRDRELLAACPDMYWTEKNEADRSTPKHTVLRLTSQAHIATTRTPSASSQASSPRRGASSAADRQVAAKRVSNGFGPSTVESDSKLHVAEVCCDLESERQTHRQDLRQSIQRWRADDIGVQDLEPSENRQALAQHFFEKFDATGRGTLSWKNGEVISCLGDLLQAAGIPSPNLSASSLFAIYSEVKASTSHDGDGLDLAQMCQFAQKVSELALVGNEEVTECSEP